MLGAFSQISASTPLITPPSNYSSSLSSPSWSRASSNPSPKRLPLASRIFIRNLSYSTNEASLIKLFSRFGHIVDVHIARHEETKESKGYAFIQYGNQEDAILAIEEMDCKLINGRAVYTDIAKPLNAGFIAYPKTCGPPLQQSP